MRSDLRAFLLCAAFAWSPAGLAKSPEAEIVVTAERRPTSVRDQAASITIIDGAEIARIGADHPSEILNRAPGVFLNRGNGVEHLTAIRSPVLTGGAGAGSFLFLQDGVPLRSAGFGNVNALFEAQTELAGRIEIVRGPSGALYGANAVHGVVNVLTPESSAEDIAGAAMTVDSIPRVKSAAFLSGTRSRHALYAGISVLHDDGFRAASSVDDQKAVLRHEFAGEGVAATTIASFVNLNQETAGFVVGPAAYRDRVLRRGNLNPEAFRDARAFRLQSEWTIRLGEGAEIRLTPFARVTDTRFLLHFFPSKALEENGHWSVGAQNALYVDFGERASLIVGADVERTEGYLREIQTLPTIGSFRQGVHYDFKVDAASVSGFVNLKAKLAPRLTASLAARFDRARYDYDNRTADGTFGRFLRPADRRDRFTTASPKASLLYDLGEASVYVSYARGSRPPQVQDLYRLTSNQTTDAARAETIDAVEAGFRGGAGDWLDLDVAVYMTDKARVFFRDADGFNVNDGRTRHVGVESAASARLGSGFVLDLNATFARHTYRFDRPALGPGLGGEAIRAGADIDSAPHFIAGARLAWAPDASPVSAELEWSHVGAYFLDAANTATYPGHDVFNLRAAWRISPRLTASAALRNLADALYAERGDIAFGEERYFPGEGRAVALTLAAKF
ncbi:MAG: TonB-dependent receptor [Parvularculaceae bacterium]|nr:TonB-dependent receptor [Parvularculaceae bacterium]